MSRFLCLMIGVLLLAIPACAPRQTWTGKLADSSCMGSHPFDEHGAPMTDKQCTLKCVADGAKFVLMSNSGTMYAIQNQSQPALAEFAGSRVDVTGHMDHDALVVSGIELAHNK